MEFPLLKIKLFLDGLLGDFFGVCGAKDKSELEASNLRLGHLTGIEYCRQIDAYPSKLFANKNKFLRSMKRT